MSDSVIALTATTVYISIFQDYGDTYRTLCQFLRWYDDAQRSLRLRAVVARSDGE
jgi:hypothetical protein